MGVKVCKFGGTSLASREQFEHVISLVQDDLSRKYIVVSAPGKRSPHDEKVTDLLIKVAHGSSPSVLGHLYQFIKEFGGDLTSTIDALCSDLEQRVLEKITDPVVYEDRLKAFGEYASAKLMETILQKKGIRARMIDPHDLGLFVELKKGDYLPHPSCYSRIRTMLAQAPQDHVIVIPGFYAYTKEGVLVTLPRGGSDTTGAVIARAVGATEYENWTDEDGLRRADPKIIQDPEIIPELTYKEARELTYLGFKLQPDALMPLIEKQIPLRVINTYNPKGAGTLVVTERIVPDKESIVGVASRGGYVALTLTKPFMNREIGFGRRVYQILEEQEISYEHSPTGIDTLSIILEKKQLECSGKLHTLIRAVNESVGPLESSIGPSMAMVAVVGLGIRKSYGVEARVLSSLAQAKIKLVMMNEGASELSFFIGVREEQACNAVRSIYNEFYGKDIVKNNKV